MKKATNDELQALRQQVKDMIPVLKRLRDEVEDPKWNPEHSKWIDVIVLNSELNIVYFNNILGA